MCRTRKPRTYNLAERWLPDARVEPLLPCRQQAQAHVVAGRVGATRRCAGDASCTVQSKPRAHSKDDGSFRADMTLARVVTGIFSYGAKLASRQSRFRSP
jgi:hypothetical protein